MAWYVVKVAALPVGLAVGLAGLGILVKHAFFSPKTSSFVSDVARRNAEMLVANMYKLVDWTVHVVWLEEGGSVPPQGGAG